MTDLDMGVVLREHDPADAATICTNVRTVTLGFGVVHTSPDGHLESYDEKPQFRYEVSMGVNVLSAWAIDRFVVRGEQLDMPELLLKMEQGSETVRVRRTEAYWLDMGRTTDLEAAVEDFEREPGPVPALDRPERSSSPGSSGLIGRALVAAASAHVGADVTGVSLDARSRLA